MMNQQTQTQDRLNALVEEFAADLTDLISEKVDEALRAALKQQNGSGASSPQRKAQQRLGRIQRKKVNVQTMSVAKNGTTTTSTVSNRRRRGQKRTDAQIEKDTQRVLRAIQKNAGIKAEELRDKLDMSTRDLQVPLARLFEQGSISYEGRTRGTRYYAE